MAEDLFVWLDAVYSKARLEGTAPLFMMHRFLASERKYATACRDVMLHIKEPDIAMRVWQGFTPQQRRAPRLSYAAAKKGPAAEALTLRMMAVTGERRRVVEEMQLVVAAAGRAEELAQYFGHETDAPKPAAKPRAKPKGGLLAGL